MIAFRIFDSLFEIEGNEDFRSSQAFILFLCRTTIHSTHYFAFACNLKIWHSQKWQTIQQHAVFDRSVGRKPAAEPLRAF
jgi:hypothetical protein